MKIENIITGALFDLMGFLTSRDERISLSSRDHASPAVDALRAFAAARNISLDGAAVSTWRATLAEPTGPLPALPDWCFRDDLGGLVPSEVRTALNEHARDAWNMGLNAGLLHAPTITDTGLLELRDHLSTAKVTGSSITLSPAAAGALHLAMTTPPLAPAVRQTPGLAGWSAYMDGPELQELKAEALALASGGANMSMGVGCMFVLAMIERIESYAAQKVAGYIDRKDLPRLGNCRATLWATTEGIDAMPVYLAAPAVPAATDVCAEMRALCSSCGGTGDVTRIDGEWLGSCDCGSAK